MYLLILDLKMMYMIDGLYTHGLKLIFQSNPRSKIIGSFILLHDKVI